MTSADAAADVEDDLAKGRSHRNLDEARVVDLAREREHLGALRRRRADLVEPVRTIVDDDRNVGQGLDVVDDRRTPPQALHRRERRTRTRHAAEALDGLEKSSLLTADERARAEAELDVKREARTEDVVTEEAELLRLLDRNLQAVNGERILRADVDEALRRTDRVARDHHRLEDAMGVAFERRTVHVRARIAFVGVADHVLLALGLLHGEFPLHAGREARAAAAAKAGLQDLLDDILGLHLEEHLLDRLVAVARNVVIDLLGVDHAAVAEDDAVLLLVERDVRLGDQLLRLLRVIAETLHDAALDEVLRDDLLDVRILDLHVERALRKDLDDRTLLAEAKAAGRHDLHGLVEILLSELLLEFLGDLVAATRAARRAAADKNVTLISHDVSFSKLVVGSW